MVGRRMFLGIVGLLGSPLVSLRNMLFAGPGEQGGGLASSPAAPSDTSNSAASKGADHIQHDLFRDPPSEFRPMPFWGLNDLLEDGELRRQIGEMKAHGWGGFFMHPRYGMETPYLTSEYMSRIKTCLDEARRQGLQGWIYDEHPFPAGCAGGLVGAERSDFRHKALVMRIHNRLTPIEEGIEYFAATLQNGVPARVERVRDPKSYSGEERCFLHFYKWTEAIQPSSHTGITNDFIHGFPYTDTLNSEAVRRFIELTYEAYRRAVGEEFGKTLKGTFSDIPVYQWHYATPHPSVPWTTDLPRYFQKECGYDLLPHLPALFLDVGDFARVRHDFWRTVNALFLDSYTKQLYNWCDQHGLIYTAHYWGEEALHWQIPWTGDVMTHFFHQHMVAIDHILRNIEDPIGVKQAATVAEQFEKPRMISETYALSGHNLTFEERKWIGDWEYALGVNFLVPYIPAYSMRGRRKRDEPPSEFFQQPYWHYESLINDYYGRLSYSLTRGRRVVDLLVLQPLSSAWTLCKATRTVPAAARPHPDAFEAAGAELFEFSEGFRRLCDHLLHIHRDFHFGNETLMAEQAKVEEGRLRIGERTYSTVLVPPSLSWFRTTINLLNEFVKQGGHVLAIEPLPSMVEGRREESILPKGIKIVKIEDLNEALPRDVQIDGGEEILFQHRRLEKSDLYFFANTSLKKSYPPMQITLPGKGVVEVWDAFLNKRYKLPHRESANGLQVELDFPAVASYLLVQKSTHSDDLEGFRPIPSKFKRELALNGPWENRRLDPNCLTLDYCQLQVAGGAWSARMPVWQAHRRVHESGVGTPFKLRFGFEFKERSSSVSVGIEDPSRYDVNFNGQLLSKKGASSWWDASIKLFDVTSRQEMGCNSLELAGRCGIDTEIENCYVVGGFGVTRGDGFQIVTEPDHVAGRNLVEEGYPFFVGRMVLQKKIHLEPVIGRAWLRFGRLEAIIAEIRINGRRAGHLAWKPYALDITDLIRLGENEIEVELCTSLHNLLGPHHDKRGEARHWVLQQSWTDTVNWTDDYFFVPVGIESPSVGFSDT